MRFTAAGEISVDARNGEDFGVLLARQLRLSQQRFVAELGEQVTVTAGMCFACKSASRYDKLECDEVGCDVKVHRPCLTHGENKWWYPHHVAQISHGGDDAEAAGEWRYSGHRQTKEALKQSCSRIH